MYLVICIDPDLCYRYCSIKGKGVRLVMSSYLCSVLLYLLRCLVYHMLSKTRRNSRSLHRVITHTRYLLYLIRCLVYHMLLKTRRNSGSLHRVIGEVLVLPRVCWWWCIRFHTAVEKRQLWVRAIKWLKLIIASCVVHQTLSLEVLILYFTYNMVFVN